MPQQKNCDRENPTPKSSHNPDWHYFWMTGLSSWGQIFQEEFLKENQKPLDRIQGFQAGDTFDFSEYLQVGGQISFVRGQQDLLINLSNEDFVNVRGNLDAAEQQLLNLTSTVV